MAVRHFGLSLIFQIKINKIKNNIFQFGFVNQCADYKCNNILKSKLKFGLFQAPLSAWNISWEKFLTNFIFQNSD